jgi:UDP-4-amino-4,6-dideoxy-N-acetyl-beta-L-altrosamine N-acetyltransferase
MSFSLNQYGITLRRIEFSDIELIREKRNSIEVRRTMAFRKKISASMQQRWFESVNNKLNYYFMIEHKGRNIGVVNCKNVDEKSGLGEGGIFTWDLQSGEEFIPVAATIILMDFIFYEIKFSNKSVVRIVKDNHRAIAYNRAIGYVKIPGQDYQNHQWYVLTREDYEKASGSIRKALSSLYGASPMEITGKASEINFEVINALIRERQERNHGSAS